MAAATPGMTPATPETARADAAAAAHGLRHAGHHHAGARHDHRQRGAALHAGHPVGATLDQANWVLTSYIVAAAIMTAPLGWLAARFGRKRLFIVCTIGFTVASMLCGIAQDIDQMVLFRLLQGVFGAALVPLSQSVMLDTYPAEQRGQAMAMWGMGVMVGPIMGPTLGGWLTETYSWRWVFFINLPVGILTVLGLDRLHAGDADQRKARASTGSASSRCQHRHRRAAADARPRRAAGLVRSRTRSASRPSLAVAGFYFFLAHSFTTARPRSFHSRSSTTATSRSACSSCSSSASSCWRPWR